MLRVENLTLHYGHSRILHGVDLSADTGQVTCLMGTNGVGKTSLIRAIAGRHPRSGGSVTLAGQALPVLPAHQMARKGVALVSQGREIFPLLTVRENLIAAARAGHWDMDRIGVLFPRLTERLEQRAASLSGGEQQMLAIGRALMTNPRLLILDEATEGLAPIVRQEIWAAISRLKRETGMAILLIDKSLRELKDVSDRAVIIERGRDVWTGVVDALDDQTAQDKLGV